MFRCTEILIAFAIESLAHESSHICGGGSRWGVVPGLTYRFKGHVGAATLLLRTVTHRMGLYRYQGSIGGNLAATFTKGKPSLKKEKAKPRLSTGLHECTFRGVVHAVVCGYCSSACGGPIYIP